MPKTVSKQKKTVGDLVSAETAFEFLYAAIGAVLYTGLPTALNLNGAGGMVVAMAPSIALGLWRKSYAFLAGSTFVALVHLMYKYGSNWTLDWWGRPIWSLDPSVPSDPGTLHDYIAANTYRSAMNDGYGMHDAVQMPNGYTALALPPADVPAPQQMNDYIRSQEQLMDNEGFLSSVRYEQNGSYDSQSMFE